MNTQKLTFLLTPHDKTGIQVEACITTLDKTGGFNLGTHKVSPKTISDFEVNPSVDEVNLLKIIDEYSDETLFTRFSKEKIPIKDFIHRISEETLTQFIRPYIEKRLTRIFELCSQKSISLYYRPKRNSTINEHPINISKDLAIAVFNFERYGTGIRYYLSVKHENHDLVLYNKQAQIICQAPCWLYINNMLMQIGQEVDGKKLQPFFTKQHIDVPRQSEKKYFETFILQTVRDYTVRAKGFEIEELELQPQAVLKLENNLAGKPHLILLFKYKQFSFLAHEEAECAVKLKTINNSYCIIKAKRQRVAEAAIIYKLQRLGLKNAGASSFDITEPGDEAGLDAIVDWLSSNQNTLEKLNIQLAQEYFANKYFIGANEIEIELSDYSDWFEIHGNVRFGKFEIPFIHLARHILSGNRYFELPDGTIALLPTAWFAKYRDLFALSNFVAEEKNIKLPKHHFRLAEQLDLQRLGPNNRISEEFIRQAEKLSAKLPDDLNASLRPYQLQGLSWLQFLHKHGFGGCLADDMGLGKTIQTIAMLVFAHAQVQPEEQASRNVQLSLFDRPSPRHSLRTSLVVVPFSLVYNWQNEFMRFAPKLKIKVHTGSLRATYVNLLKDADVIITTYGTLRNDIDLFCQLNLLYLVIDESQNIKNRSSQIFQTIKQLKAENKLALTGTPIENSLSDLWSQIEVLNPGLLGDYSSFTREFIEPAEQKNYPQTLARLKHIVEPFILRRTKEQVLKELPQLTQQIIYCEMSESQNRLYEEKKSAIRNLILQNMVKQGAEKTRFLALGGLMKLRLIANHPGLDSGSGEDDASGKFNEVFEMLQELIAENHKVLIFSQFVKHLQLFEDEFNNRGWNYCMLTGQLNQQKRQEMISRFQKEAGVLPFLISLKAGGTGLNLTQADYVFVLDPWWNPQAENQAISRAHRIGQKNKVFAYKFITKNTVEEKILLLQEKKLHLADSVIENINPLKLFSDNDLVSLFD